MSATLSDFGEIAPIIAVTDEAAFTYGAWVEAGRAALAAGGAVLLRGPIQRPDAAERALAFLDDELLEDAFWSTPRSKVQGKTLTATDYPSPRTIALHSEMAYMRSWPRFVAFHSLVVADRGGETTICDLDAFSRDIVPLIEPFRRYGVLYRRTFQKGVDVRWQQAFQTEDRKDVEKMGRRLGMEVTWLPNDVLVTSHTAQGAIAAEDGGALYFNQAHLFHPSALEPEVRATLEKALGDRLPRQAFYGDGSPIADETLAEVRQALERHQTRMCWRPGDILILDNMRYLHGRLPFSGARRLHVSLAKLETEPTRTSLPPSRREARPAPAKTGGLFKRLLART